MKIQRKIDGAVVVVFEIINDYLELSWGEGVISLINATELFRDWEPATAENIAKSVWKEVSHDDK